MASIAVLGAFLVLCLGAGWLGAQITAPALVPWYASLAKPWYTPPSWVFGPVWTTLYVLMAIAAWLVWRHGGVRSQAWPVLLFIGQLALNVLWSYLFFGLRDPRAALVGIGVLWVAVLLTLVVFIRRDMLAGLLFVPYLLWVSYAVVLNWSIWRLNA